MLRRTPQERTGSRVDARRPPAMVAKAGPLLAASLTLCLGLGAVLPAAAEEEKPPANPSLEIPDVVVEGSEPPVPSLPTVTPGEPKLETQFNPPPAGPSATERDLSTLRFQTEPQVFTPSPMSFRDSRTSLSGSFGKPDWFQFSGWDSRQIGPMHTFLQADFANGTGIVSPWLKGAARIGLGVEGDGWRITFAGDGDGFGRRGDFGSASQIWGNGRLSAVHALGANTLTYRLGWETGLLAGTSTAAAAAASAATGIGDRDIHGGDAGVRWEPQWGSHKPFFDVGGGFHWAGLSSWPVGSVTAADRFQLGAADLDLGVTFDQVGTDSSVAPVLRAAWRGWPETVLTAAVDGGQQTPFAGNLLRQRPFAQFGTDLRSEYMLAQFHLNLERRLAKGLVLGLGADAGGIDRKLYWSRVGDTPFWQLRNAPGPMLLWGGTAGLRYELGGVTPFVHYRFQQASTPDAQASYPTDGSHDLRLGFQMGFEKFRMETSARLLLWNLSPLASGRQQGAQPNALLLDGALAYDITDTVHAHLRVSDGLLRSSDMLPGYWEPAMAVMGGVGVTF